MIYYIVALALSFIFTGIYVLKYKKYFDSHVTVFFTLIPVVELGYLMCARATTSQAALLAVNITYIAGFYLTLFMKVMEKRPER